MDGVSSSPSTQSAAPEADAAGSRDARTGVLRNTRVRVRRSLVSAQALGAATAELHGACVLAVASAQPNTGRLPTTGAPLRPADWLNPSYTERLVMPYRHNHVRREFPNEREVAVEGLYERVLRALLPTNFPVEITMQGSLVRASGLNSRFGGAGGFNAARLPDAPVLYGNALSYALAQANIISAPFAAVRVAARASTRRGAQVQPGELVLNPSCADMHLCAPQMLYIGTAEGPLHVAYDTLAGAGGVPVSHKASRDMAPRMLEVAHAAVRESIEQQHVDLAAHAGRAAPQWPSLQPSPGAINVLTEMCGKQIDALLSSGPAGRAEQSLHASQLEVRAQRHSLLQSCRWLSCRCVLL